MPAPSCEPPVVFLFPGLGGGERELAGLQAGCPPDLRCVTLEYPDWTEVYARGIGLDGLIAHCMQRIETLAPRGPLFLAGYSFGGLMAFAVAGAFTASGRAVTRLGLLDSASVPTLLTSRLTLIGRWQRFSGAIRRGELGAEIGLLIAAILIRSDSPRLFRAAVRIRHVRLPLRIDEHVAVALQIRFRLPMLRVLVDRIALTPKRVDIPTVLFRCQDQEPGAANDLGWGRYLEHLQIVPVVGDHHSFIDPENSPSLCASFIAAMREPSTESVGSCNP